MKPVIGIAHASFAEGRAEGLARLRAQLDPQGATVYVQVSDTKEHAQVWARRLWAWAAAQDSPAILLNDDVTVSPDLVARVDAMTDILPNEIIALHSQLPAARSLAEAGVTWLRSYWCSGPGYVLPRSVSSKLDEWVGDTAKPILDAYNEDGYLQMWAWGRRRPIWHCLPALVQHDTEIASTLGYDKHTLRVAVVDWTDPLYAAGLPKMTIDSPAPFIENPWMSTETLMALEAKRDMHGGPDKMCWWCMRSSANFSSAVTGAWICATCIHVCVGASLGVAQKMPQQAAQGGDGR